MSISRMTHTLPKHNTLFKCLNKDLGVTIFRRNQMTKSTLTCEQEKQWGICMLEPQRVGAKASPGFWEEAPCHRILLWSLVENQD